MSVNTQQNNSKDNALNTNTRGYQFSNKNGFDPSAFTFGFWNDMISFRINPALDPDKQTDSKVFDYEKYVSTSLTLEKAMVLLYKIEKSVRPAIENEENKSTAVQVGGDTLVVIGTTDKFTESPTQFLAIHKSINPETKIPEMSMYYEFRTIDTIDDFDEKTGTYVIDNNIRSEFELFVVLLKAAVKALGNAEAHSLRNVNRWMNDKTTSTLNSIAEKVGAQTNSYSNSNKFKSNVSWQNNSSNSSDSVEIQELDNIEDINEFLN